MRVHGGMEKLMDSESSSTQMAMFMKETGSMTKLTGMEHILTRMAQSMLANGEMISNMVLD